MGFLKRNIKAFLCALSMALLCLSALFSGCSLFDDGIDVVRERVEKLRYEMSDTIVDALENNDVSAIKDLFCVKSREIAYIDEQIENSFGFMEGRIASYKVSGSTGYESYSNAYGKILQYSFGSDVYITTDSGRRYDLYMSVNYIEADDVIKGLTFYTLSEFDKENYDDIERVRAGFGWSSPYDAECGKAAARLITAVATGDKKVVEDLLCEQQEKSKAEIDVEIDKAFEFFDGVPTFTERDDGLYSGWVDGELVCRTLGYETVKDSEGNVVSIWASVIAHTVITDTGKNYSLDFSVYLINTDKPQLEGISYFTFEESATDTRVDVGGLS